MSTPTTTNSRGDAAPSVALIGCGTIEKAKYQPTGIERYDGNPYIEALPPILTDAEASKLMANYPKYSDKDRGLPAEKRVHLIHNALDLFVPLREHMDLQQRFSCMIRSGYSRRNPIQRGYWQDVDHRVANLSPSGGTKLFNRSSATGMSIIGISGGGKTTAAEAALNLNPQVIVHSNFRGQPFTNTQVVWLKLQCPFDGSVRGLCINFFQAIDGVSGTNHFDRYAKGRRTVDELLPNMARAASIHGLGLLAIDEIQHLSQSKSGGRERMLNFFCQLVNTIGVPVIFIGTFKAISVLGDEFRQIRRSSGEGDFIWNRMLKDAKWNFFVEALWTYQYVKTPSPLTAELRDVLYDESQGITDFAVKLYMLAQIRAIAGRKEVLTPIMIRSVAEDSLRMAQPVLRALRTGDTKALQLLNDVYPIDFAVHAQKIRASSPASEPKAPPADIMQPETLSSASGRKSETGKQASAKTLNVEGSSLPDLVTSGGKQDIGPYESLKVGNIIRDGSEFFINSQTKKQ